MGTKERDRTLETTQEEMERRRRAAEEWRARARGERGQTADGGAPETGDADPSLAADAQRLTPQPERDEPRLADPGLTDLSRTDWKAVLQRTGKSAMRDQVTDLAAALAYYSFMAIPAALLVAVGICSLVLSPSSINTLVDKLSSVVPQQATDLLLGLKPGGAGALIGVGTLLALWSTTGAMTAFMRALNRAYGREETRSFVRQRLVALEMVAIMGLAFLLVMVLLVLGPSISSAIGDATGMPALFKTIWWVAQWPILLVGLIAAFSTLLYLGPNVEHPRWRFLTPGAALSALLWIVASGLFAVYTSNFSSYGGAWGPLAAVIVLLTWLWLTGIALLLGAELNAELERSRELRRGEPAERTLQAPAKA
jgi:membrane protein